jgi:3',5'-cyclic-AMP phosphodiesterase
MLRRDLLLSSAALPALTAAPAAFRVVHFTDSHIQPELRAAEAVGICFDQIAREKPDFCLAGGDMIFDALAVSEERATQLYDLYLKTAARLRCKVYATPGNHEYFGVLPDSGVSASHPLYGSRMFEARIGQRYQSFVHKGWHFVMFDSVAIEGRDYKSGVDAEQLRWLESVLQQNRSLPTIMTTHIPVMSAVLQSVPEWRDRAESILLRNSAEVLALLQRFDVRMVLQGHTHICETVRWKGIDFVTTGAVCANWWKGARMGFREGYGVLNFRGDKVSYRFVTYPWEAAI